MNRRSNNFVVTLPNLERVFLIIGSSLTSILAVSSLKNSLDRSIDRSNRSVDSHEKGNCTVDRSITSIRFLLPRTATTFIISYPPPPRWKRGRKSGGRDVPPPHDHRARDVCPDEARLRPRTTALIEPIAISPLLFQTRERERGSVLSRW